MIPSNKQSKQLQDLDFQLPQNLPQPPLFLVDLARNCKKLKQIRYNKETQGTDAQKKWQGIVMDSYQKALIEMDKMHMKAVIELKTLNSKNQRLTGMVDNLMYNESRQDYGEMNDI